MTPQQLWEWYQKRVALKEMETHEEAALEEALFGNSWEEVSRHSNRLAHIQRQRRRLEDTLE